jgi:hypothetical protein
MSKEAEKNLSPKQCAVLDMALDFEYTMIEHILETVVLDSCPGKFSSILVHQRDKTV